MAMGDRQGQLMLGCSLQQVVSYEVNVAASLAGSSSSAAETGTQRGLRSFELALLAVTGCARSEYYLQH